MTESHGPMESHGLILRAIADLKADQNRRIDELKRDQNWRLDSIDKRLETMNSRVRKNENEITRIKSLWTGASAIVGGAIGYISHKLGL